MFLDDHWIYFQTETVISCCVKEYSCPIHDKNIKKIALNIYFQFFVSIATRTLNVPKIFAFIWIICSNIGNYIWNIITVFLNKTDFYLNIFAYLLGISSTFLHSLFPIQNLSDVAAVRERQTFCERLRHHSSSGEEVVHSH